MFLAVAFVMTECRLCAKARHMGSPGRYINTTVASLNRSLILVTEAMSDRRSSFSWEIPPFYEARDASSHPTLPILLAQTELIVQQPQQLLATQEIGPRSSLLADRHQRTRVRFTPSKGRVADPPAASDSHEATPGRSTRIRGGSAPPPLRSNSAAPSDYDDGTSARGRSATPGASADRGRLRRDSDACSDDLIPKPDGEVGRPKRGGYNLQKALGWPTNEYLRFKV